MAVDDLTGLLLVDGLGPKASQHNPWVVCLLDSLRTIERVGPF